MRTLESKQSSYWNDANTMLDNIIKNNWLQAKAVIGFGKQMQKGMMFIYLKMEIKLLLIISCVSKGKRVKVK